MKFQSLIKKKSRAKPFYKQIIRLRDDVLLQKKILYKFKKHKWKNFVFHARRKIFKRYKKFKIRNTQGYCVSSKPNKWQGLKSKHRNLLYAYKRFKLFYGLFSKKTIKNIIQKVKKVKKEKRLRLLFYNVMERRLDAVIYRSKFSFSPKSARQLIMHGNVVVNGHVTTNPAFHTKTGDLVQIASTRSVLKQIVRRTYYARVWPHPPAHLYINYKTLQIIIGAIRYRDLKTCFSFDIHPEKMVYDYYYK